jgi:hypothetical protein
MRAHEIILEYGTLHSESELAYATKLIQANCASYLRYGLSIPFFRGTHTRYTEITEYTTIKNRSPKDMPLEIHQFLDNWFAVKLGHRWRSEATFATGSETESKQYGFPYVFIPIGDFDFCWSDTIDDLFSAVDIMLTDTGFGSTFHYDEDDIKKMTPQLIEMLQTYGVNGSLQAARASMHEVLFNCEKYYLLPPALYYELNI